MPFILGISCDLEHVCPWLFIQCCRLTLLKLVLRYSRSNPVRYRLDSSGCKYKAVPLSTVALRHGTTLVGSTAKYTCVVCFRIRKAERIRERVAHEGHFESEDSDTVTLVPCPSHELASSPSLNETRTFLVLWQSAHKRPCYCISRIKSFKQHIRASVGCRHVYSSFHPPIIALATCLRGRATMCGYVTQDYETNISCSGNSVTTR